MCQVVIQDYNTLTVLDVAKIEDKIFNKIIDSQSLKNTIFENSYILKQVYHNPKANKATLKVKLKKGNSDNILTKFNQPNLNPYAYLRKLEKKINDIIDEEKKDTHVHSVIKRGKPKIAQKFGEEAVELVIEAGKKEDTKFIDEAADVFYYYLILLHERGFHLGDVLSQLKNQKRKN